MPTYPTTRRFFRDEEGLNENAAIAGAVRALALGQNYRYARDLKITPSDAKVFSAPFAAMTAGGYEWPWLTGTGAFPPVKDFWSGLYGALTGNVAEILVPESRSPARSVAVHVNVVFYAAGTLSGSVTVLNASTGASATIPVAGTPAAAGDLWFSTTITASPGDLLRVSAAWTSGLGFTVASVCSWWDPASMSLPGATFSAGWSALSQTFHATNGPLSTYALRWLGRSANASVYERPTPVSASWHHNPAAGTAAGYSAMGLVLGRYRLPIGGRTGNLTIRLRYRSSGACSISCVLSGGGSASAAIGGAGYGVATAVIARTPGAFSVEELELSLSGSPSYCEIEHVLVYESSSSATDLALPSGELLPGSFDPNVDERLASGRAIRADDLARLISNEVWLWAYRRNRVLVNDCRFTYNEASDAPFTGVGGVTDRAALHEIVTSKRNTGDAFGELRIWAGFHQGTMSSAFWEAYGFQVGEVASGDSPGSPLIGSDVRYASYPIDSWASFGREQHQHRRGGAIAGSTVYAFETIVLTAGHSFPIAKSTRPCSLVIEELPLNSPAVTYP